MQNKLMRLRDFRGAIVLAGDNTVGDVTEVQVMRAGAWQHPLYGAMIITPQTLADMVNNFANNVRRQMLPVDYFHESDREAAGWFQELYVSGDTKNELWGKVKWTPRARQMLADGELKYFSADFFFEWTDPETGVAYKNVLNGGGLVNRPFIKDMDPVAELSEGNDQMKTVEQLNPEIKSLTETHAAKVTELSETLKSKESEIANLKGEKAALLKEKEVAAKESKFKALCDEGKACAAQKEAYMAGDMEAYAALAVKLNVATRETNQVIDSARELSADESAICEKLGLTKAEYLKANP